MKAYSRLSAEERVRIDELRNREGLGVRQIALRIGRDKSTVSRELRRGLWFASNENGSHRPYRPKRLKAGAWTSRPFHSAMTAQRKAEQRARQPRKPGRMAYSPLLAWVMDALRKGWTPERVEGGLKAERPSDPRMRVGHECLCRWICAKPRRALDLRRYPPRGKRHRTRARGRRSKGPRIPMRAPIAGRPKRVDPRREFGHYESDTVIGPAPSKRRIDTQVERKSRRPFARLIPDKSAPATARAEYGIHKDIPAPAHIDRTRDNGTESSCHLLVDEAPGMLAYLADPYSSYQRGSNENRNGRIRRYLPKRTSLDNLTDAGRQAIVREINDTPMKAPNWETPNEVWYRELGKVMSKTSHPKTSVALTN